MEQASQSPIPAFDLILRFSTVFLPQQQHGSRFHILVRNQILHSPCPYRGSYKLFCAKRFNRSRRCGLVYEGPFEGLCRQVLPCLSARGSIIYS